MLISEQYRQLNEELHARNPNYGSSGGKWAPLVHRIAGEVEAKTVLDYGSGKGTLKLAMENGRWTAPIMQYGLPYEVLEYDPAIPGKEVRPPEADLVVCGDVLEHVEPECLDDVLDDLADVAKRAVILMVESRPAKKHLADGRNAHLIVEPARWWIPKILERWNIKSFAEAEGYFTCIAVPM